MKALGEKLDRLPKDQQHVDNMYIDRRVSGAVPKETFSRVPDPVAGELAGLEDERSRSQLEEEKKDSPGEALVKEEHVEDHGDGVNVLREGVGREITKAQEEEGIEDKDFRKLSPEDKDKNLVSEEDLEGFDGDWLAWSRRRTRKVEQTTLVQNVWKGRGERMDVIARSAAGREEKAENGGDDLSSGMGKEEEKVQRRTRNGRNSEIDCLEASIADLELQLEQQREAFAEHIAEERERWLKEREENKARVHAMEARVVERVERLERQLANEAQHRVQARLEQHRGVVQVPRTAHGPRYTRILWGFGVALGAFGLLIVVLMLYLKVTYEPLVI